MAYHRASADKQRYEFEKLRKERERAPQQQHPFRRRGRR